MDTIQFYRILNVKNVIIFVPHVLDLLLMIAQLAIILLILRMWDQHVDVKSVSIIKNSLNHAPSVINYVKFVIKQQLMVVQVVILIQIEYQKEQNVNVNLVIMNQMVFVQIALTEDVFLKACYLLCINNQQLWHTNTCISCDSGFDLIFGKCEPICGDLQIIGYDQCEDNNNIMDDLCYNCQFQCPAHCITCNESTTLPCPDICGDGMVTGQKNVKMETILNMMDVLIANINANPNVQNVLKESVLNVQLVDGKLIQQFNHGNVKRNVEIYKQQDKNDVMMEIKMIRMDVKIVNISVELDVHLVIMTQTLVQIVNYLGLFQKSIIVKISAEICWLQQIHMDFIRKNVMMGIKLIMMDVVRIVNFNVKFQLFALVVQIIDVKFVLLDIIYLIKVYVYQFVEIYWQQLVNNAKIHQHYLIKVVKIAKQNVKLHVLFVIILDLDVRFVDKVTIQLMVNVIQNVGIKQQHRMKNVMMEIQYLEMDVINIHLLVLYLVLIVFVVFVMIAMKVINTLSIHVQNFLMIIMIQDVISHV
ncbi:unnamed protein product [Paramecium pentaurelia]|uniref:4Fe-4S ferredoxin-type domain-containing protein n=1 Tax=Paramecium pentaurelia TaxID=43138 RepID=A0A8S1WMV7_9CILI|nr:unnamed protein product [Paramecium pentaurelia]